MTQHYNPTMGETSEEITTEDGKHKYWRLAVPLPLFTGLIVKRYGCSCGKKFPGLESYELHYRKAYEEEKHQAYEEEKYLAKNKA